MHMFRNLAALFLCQARAVHGAYVGTWYYEVRMQHLGATGHARLGWGTRKAELQAPVRLLI